MSDIDTVTVDSLKALDPNRPIREADIALRGEISNGSPTSVRRLIVSTNVTIAYLQTKYSTDRHSAGAFGNPPSPKTMNATVNTT